MLPALKQEEDDPAVPATSSASGTSASTSAVSASAQVRSTSPVSVSPTSSAAPTSAAANAAPANDSSVQISEPALTTRRTSINPPTVGAPGHVHQTAPLLSPVITNNHTLPSLLPLRNDAPPMHTWRVRDRMTTVHGIIALCLNIGVDPPDVLKQNPCARLQAWLQPDLEHPTKSINIIGEALRKQYERWFPPKFKIDFRFAPDPTVADIRRVCANLRRAAKNDRILFHYNGHGVLKPTPNGEIWFFNQTYSEYIPVSLADLNEMLSSPTLYIFECHSAGTILRNFLRTIDQSSFEGGFAQHQMSHRLPVFLAACGDGELLPMNPHVPADLFTSCLTTPIKTALRWFARRSLMRKISVDMVDRIPGDVNIRVTPLGELDYILTAITDTIAWNVLPRELFIKLYRQDVLLAVLMRNFLLAQRIMRSFGCNPVSYPALPDTHQHHLWNSFDIAMENVILQLPAIIAEQKAQRRASAAEKERVDQHSNSNLSPASAPGQSSPPYPSTSSPVPHSTNAPQSLRTKISQAQCAISFRPSSFFEDQMKAFSVWLDMGRYNSSHPEVLPILLQLLLAAPSRVKAISLISRYVQTGPAAVDLALSVGIFPYIIRLLEKDKLASILDRKHLSGTRNDLVFIWSKILAFDESCQADVIKLDGDLFFVNFLFDASSGIKPILTACALFVLSVIAREYSNRCCSNRTIEACEIHLTHSHPLVRRWACLCLTEIFVRADVQASVLVLSRTPFVDRLCAVASADPEADVRAAAISTISVIMNGILRHASSGKLPSQSKTDVSTYPLHDDLGRRGLSNSRSHIPSSSSSSPSDIDVSTLSDVNSVATESIMRKVTPAPFSEEEKQALLKLGCKIAPVGYTEASVLVRREAALAIATAAQVYRERFIDAALETEACVDGYFKYYNGNENSASCACAYRALWESLSELAFDSHPVVAATARNSFDLVFDIVLQRTASFGTTGGQISTSDNELPNSGRAHLSLPVSAIQTSSPVPSDGDVEDASETIEGQNPLCPLQNVNGINCSRSGGHFDEIETATAQESDGVFSRTNNHQNVPRPPCDLKSRAVRGVHVRSASGSFDIGVLSRDGKYSKVLSVEGLPTRETAPKSLTRNINGCQTSFSNLEACSSGTTTTTKSNESESRPMSLPHVALMNGFGNLVKTFSQQLHIQNTPNCSHSSSVETEECEHCRRHGTSYSLNDRHEVRDRRSANGRFSTRKKFSDGVAHSPPRPPKRSLSYQVLHESSAFSPTKEAPPIADPRKTSYSSLSKLTSSDDEGARPLDRCTPQTVNRMAVSSIGDAALSLYEWSRAYMFRAEGGSTVLDYYEEEGIARYATLWSVINRRGGSDNKADRLRAFALLGKGDDVIATDTGDDYFDGEPGKKEFAHSRELTLFEMGAGGGSISALIFLPRDTGIGDDQLVATGDTNGSVGVYDAKTGKCQGAFGVPVAPGVPEVGISSILCLNPHGTDNPSGYGLSNSHTALILAGARDGRVAVFRSDFVDPNYRIMSTFQACGRSRSGRAVWSRNPFPMPLGKTAEGEDNASIGTCETWKGHGLQLGFNVNSAKLAAGGCDEEVVRVWDLVVERCTWEGAVMAKGVVPTSITMWKSGNPNVFVAGGSDGGVYVADMREKSSFQTSSGYLLGRHKGSIVTVGTCPPHGTVCGRETVVSADRSGDVVVWDPRWRGADWRVQDSFLEKLDVRRIGAHHSDLTAMCVHRTGRYIASGSKNCVKIFGEERDMVKMVSHYGTLHQDSHQPEKVCQSRLSPVSALAFQHETSLLAIGCTDGSVMLHGRHRDLFPGINS